MSSFILGGEIIAAQCRMVPIFECESKNAFNSFALDKSKSFLVAAIALGIKLQTACPNLPAAPVIKIDWLINENYKTKFLALFEANHSVTDMPFMSLEVAIKESFKSKNKFFILGSQILQSMSSAKGETPASHSPL